MSGEEIETISDAWRPSHAGCRPGLPSSATVDPFRPAQLALQLNFDHHRAIIASNKRLGTLVRCRTWQGSPPPCHLQRRLQPVYARYWCSRKPRQNCGSADTCCRRSPRQEWPRRCSRRCRRACACGLALRLTQPSCAAPCFVSGSTRWACTQSASRLPSGSGPAASLRLLGLDKLSPSLVALLWSSQAW